MILQESDIKFQKKKPTNQILKFWSNYKDISVDMQ